MNRQKNTIIQARWIEALLSFRISSRIFVLLQIKLKIN